MEDINTPEHQNIIEAIGMTPETFSQISDDVRSHIFTSQGYLQQSHGLSEVEAEAVLTELQNQGLVDKTDNGGSYGVYPDGVNSREITQRQRIRTSKLGRAILAPTIQSVRENIGLNVHRLDSAKKIVIRESSREQRRVRDRLQESQRETEGEWQDKYDRRVQEIAEAHINSDQADTQGNANAKTEDAPEEATVSRQHIFKPVSDITWTELGEIHQEVREAIHADVATEKKLRGLSPNDKLPEFDEFRDKAIDRVLSKKAEELFGLDEVADSTAFVRKKAQLSADTNRYFRAIVRSKQS